MNKQKTLAVIELSSKIPFPGLILEVDMKSDYNRAAFEYGKNKGEPVLLLNKNKDGIYGQIGVLGIIDTNSKNPSVHLTKRFERLSCEEFVGDNGVRIILADGFLREDQEKSEKFLEKYHSFISTINEVFGDNYNSGDEDPETIISFIAFNAFDFSLEERQKILAENSLESRMDLMLILIRSRRKSIRNKKIEEIKRQTSLVNANSEENANDQEEQNDKENQESQFLQKLSKLKMPANVKKLAKEEYKRLEALHPSSSEYGVIKNYLTWIMALPWSKSTKDNIDLAKAKKVLDEDHYGMEKIKNRILEFLAVSKLKNNMKGPIICLAGPPGVGKTSLCRSISTALNRQYHRISLGGVRDEAEIRGHRKTYVGSMPGRIIKGLKQTGTNNPLFVLDEIDKLTVSSQGDPTAAMLEVLDPEQNHSFQDHYLEVPFDLSKVMFIATANYVQNIPAPLRDRMEIINISGYTVEEKINIAEDHLVDKSKKDNGLTKTQMKISREILEEVISEYTREAGVRGLKRKLDALSRFAAKKIVEDEVKTVKITKEMLKPILGKTQKSSLLDIKEPGVVNGLAWTQNGGEVLNIEASSYPGAKGLTLSGSLKKVMEESANLAMILIKSKAKKWKIEEKDFQKIHIHVPSGAIPKDGPSAGVTFVTALMSLINNKAISPSIAMTGEISLKGAVLPVGGVKDKIMGAYKEGVKTVYIPKSNEEDLEDISEEILKEIEIKPISNIEELLKDLKLI